MFTLQISKVDAEIIKCVSEVQLLELKLGHVSTYDYRAILVPLVKLYLKVSTQTAQTCTVISSCTYYMFVCFDLSDTFGRFG